MAQSYYYKKYGVQEGLPSDIIKGVQQDSLGFFWIATDEGVAKYDGLSFSTYPEISTSNYMKGFVKTRDNRHLLFGDLDFYEIINLEDTVIFKEEYPATRTIGDSSISYPKSIYEDQDGRLWISETQSIVLLDGDKMKRFDFGVANRTTQFLRSFAVFEDKKSDVYAVSFQGNLFKYNEGQNTFEAVKNSSFPNSIEYAGVIGHNLVIGAFKGIYVSGLRAEGGFAQPKLKKEMPEVSYIESIGQNRILVASRKKQHFITDSTFRQYTPLDEHITNINHVYISDEQDIWLSSNDGLILMRENLFQRVNDVDGFIETVAETPNKNQVYFANNVSLYTYDKESKQSEFVMSIPEGYFQSAKHTDQGLWIANAFNVFLYSDNRLIKEFDFSNQPRFASELAQDSYGNMWVTIISNTYAHKIKPNLEIQKYEVPLSEEGVINNIQEGPYGIYIASSGSSSYLFHKPHVGEEFINISIPFETNTSLDVNSLAFHNDDIYLASSIGLLKYNEQSISKVDLGERYSSLPIRSLEEYGDHKLLMSSAFGLILFDIDNGVIDLFNESYGLLSRSISPNGIMVQNDETVWISTSKGLCYSATPLLTDKGTKTPKIIEAYSDGKRTDNLRDIQVQYDGILSFSISSITFPESDVNYQYRLMANGPWINTPNEILLTDLKTGHHSLEVRAKKFGPYKWSQVNSIDFTVKSPYWTQPLFIFLIFIITAALVAIIYWFVNLSNKQKQRKMQALIDEKTNELKEANLDLQALNNERSNLMEIVAHDLKSPLSQIAGLVDLMKADREFAVSDQSLDMITQSTSNLTGMISKILNVRNVDSKKLNIQLEEVDLSKELLEVAEGYIPLAKKKEIRIEFDIKHGLFALVDAGFVKQIFDNLISNAVKFSPKNSTVFIKLSTESNQIQLEVADEGPGLSDDDKKKLFNKFQRLSAKPTGNEFSTGLGLSIVKRVVKELNGEVWVESEHGKGARFFVSFPALAIKKSSKEELKVDQYE